MKHCAVVHKKAFEKSLDSIGGSDPSLSASIHMPEQPSQSAPAPQQIIRSGESVTGGPIHFIGKDVWVKLAGGDLPGSLTVMEDLLRHTMARPSMHILLRNVLRPCLNRLKDDSHNRRLRSAQTLIQESKLLLLSPGVPALPLGQSDSFRSSVCKMR